ncbi:MULTISPECIES: hypothetical protein [unclassified Arcicella]|uniref:hypothetical protein n=1 Tax=unclassified Arcicella TaxID=2644986 RepID=UPI00285DB1E6|nr:MULTISPECIES: hypothetical protein [unclassified Arcicella]MDR6561151.1 hypothetical protein [Arcicella sp. BE51]MDR6811035.1 hypothetical protein [Arcicella sp. BE140]MDR6822385.1 hypothetical protein [Arcicella sp. BE139]
MKKYYWTGICNENRNTGISIIQECINKYGFITDYKFFSDISMSMFIEINESLINTLYADLSKTIIIIDHIEANSDATIECLILFNITFSKGTGNMKVEIPAVPG